MTLAHYRIFELEFSRPLDGRLLRHVPIRRGGAGNGLQRGVSREWGNHAALANRSFWLACG